MAWYEFFIENGQDLQDSNYYFPMITYTVLLIIALLFLFYTFNKAKTTEKDKDAFDTIKYLFLGLSISIFSYVIQNTVIIFTDYTLKAEVLTSISLIGSTFSLYSINLFLLLAVRFRTKTRKLMIFLASLSISIIVIVNVFIFTSVFYILPSFVMNFVVFLVGPLIILVFLTSIVLVGYETQKTASKLNMIRLKYALIGLTGLLATGVLTIVNATIELVWKDAASYRLYMTAIYPVLLLVFRIAIILGFYFSAAPPKFALQKAGLLPSLDQLLVVDEGHIKEVEK